MQRIIPGFYPKFPGAAPKARIAAGLCGIGRGNRAPREPNSAGASLYGAEVAPEDGRAGNLRAPVGNEGLPTAGTPRAPPGSAPAGTPRPEAHLA